MRGVLGRDDAVLAGIAELLAPGAEAALLVSVLQHDNAPAIPPAATLPAAYRRHGLSLVEARGATPAEVAASHSSWAKRLRAGSQRPVTLLRAVDASSRPLESELPTNNATSGRQRGSPTLRS